MGKEKALAVIVSEFIGKSFAFVNQLAEGWGETVEVLDSFASARGGQVFLLMFSEKNMGRMRDKIAQMYQNDRQWEEVSAILVENVQHGTLEAIAGLPARSAESAVLVVESLNLGYLLRVYNSLLLKWGEAVLTLDFQMGLGQGGKASFYLTGSLKLLREINEFLEIHQGEIDVALLSDLSQALAPLFQFKGN